MEFQLVKGERLYIYLAAEENSAVQIAARNLVRDLYSVLEAEARICTKLCSSTKTQMDAEACSSSEVCACTEACSNMDVEMKVPVERKTDTEKNIGENDCKIIIRTGLSDDVPGADRLKDANGNYRKESFQLRYRTDAFSLSVRTGAARFTVSMIFAKVSAYRPGTGGRMCR